MALLQPKVFLLLALVDYISSVHSRTLCPRIFFQNIDEDKMPYKFLESVLVKQNYNNDNFPVYKQEKGDFLLYLMKHTNGDSLYFGPNLQRYVAAASTSKSGATWLSSGVIDRNDVFSGLISYWVYFDGQNQKNYRVTVPPYIKAICVDDDFRECNSEKVYFNDDFTDGLNVNNQNTDYFKRESNTFRNLRPVYKHNKQNWYLQYTSDNYWLVTTTRYPSNSYDSGALIRVKDYALRPEYVTGTWWIRNNGWKVKPHLKLRCRGVSSQSNSCNTSPCFNDATCVFTSGNETVCVCPPGYYGPTCSNSKTCPTLHSERGEIGFNNPGKIPGYLAVTYCIDSLPSKRFAICTDSYYTNPYWSRQGRACTKVFTKSKSYWKTQWSEGKPQMNEPGLASPINFDDVPGLGVGILTCAILLQILVPFVVRCYAICATTCKEIDEDEEDQQRLHEFEVQLESRLQNVRRAECQGELDQEVQDYRRTVEEYQRETEATQINRKKGLYRNASIWRILSMDFYISFYLWVIYLIACRVTQCEQYGSICSQLEIMATVMVIICPIYVLIESIFSHELSYISNIMEDDTAWGYIQKMHSVAPVVSMTVECYHMETRTRVVSYTDSRGNRKTRTETYQERVVTYVDNDEFTYGCWVDDSKKEMPALSYVALTRLKIDDHVLFGDQETEADFDRQRSEMLDRNRHRDESMTFSSSKSIPGHKKRISAYVDMASKPGWIGKGWYWVATLLMLTWPYRWYFRAKTDKSYYDLKKKMYKSTSPPADIMDPIAILQQDCPSDSEGDPLLEMSERPNSTMQTHQNATAPPPYNELQLPTNQTPAYPPNNGQPAYTAANQEPACTLANQGAVFPPVNQELPYPPALQGANQGPPYPSANQGPPYPLANQGPPYPLANQGLPKQIPDFPPPTYDAAVGKAPSRESAAFKQ